MLLIDANDFLPPPPHQIVQNTWGGGVLTKRFLADKTIGIKLFITFVIMKQHGVSLRKPSFSQVTATVTNLNG